MRYRCIKNNVELNRTTNRSKYSSRDTVILNGENAYVRAPNTVSHIRNFEIEVDVRLDKLLYDHTKISDTYTIFNVEGNDFTLFYSSFKRYTLQFFDKENKFYQI